MRRLKNKIVLILLASIRRVLEEWGFDFMEA